MSAHSKFNPSGSDKRYLCPASYAVEQQCEDGSSSFAEEGTDCHELSAACLNTGNPAEFYLGKTMGNGYTVTDEMAESVNAYVAKIREYANGHSLLVEQKVTYAPAVGISDDEGWGTSDAVIITSDCEELQVHDAKFGYLQVDASTAPEEVSEEVAEYLQEAVEKESAYVEIVREDGTVIRKGNRQLMCYALGAYLDFGMLGDFKRIRLVIHQPRLGHLSEWDCTVDDLMAFAKEEAYAILQCRNAETIHSSGALDADSSYFNPGPKQCRFCRFAGQCVPLANHVAKLVHGNPISLTPRRLGEVIDEAPLIGAWLKAIRAEGERRAFAGTPPIGKDGAFKLVRGRRGKRRYVDEAAAEAQLKQFRLKLKQMYKFTLISPTAAEKVLKTKPKQWEKLQPLITQSEGGISLAPATDKRPAYAADTPSADDFEDLTQQTAVA